MLSRATPRPFPRCCRTAQNAANIPLIPHTPRTPCTPHTTVRNASHIRGGNAARVKAANPSQPGLSTTPSYVRLAHSSYYARASRKQQQLYRSLLAITLAAGAATLSQYYINHGQLLRTAHAEAPPEQQQQDEEQPLVFEQSRKKPGVSKEENRELISSQHLQVKRSWERPGVYAWGSNAGRVVAPDSSDSVVKTPRRIPFFDGKLLRDIKLDRHFGAAIDESGNLLQWGSAYAPDTTAPVETLRGKNLVSLALSRDRILALSRAGTIYSIPVAAEDQASGTKPRESSWFPFWSSTAPIAYRTVTPPDLAYTERVTSLTSGLEHALLLTDRGRVFSFAAASDAYPARGQLGVPGLTWQSRPAGPPDQPHELATLRGFPVAAVACGDRHSLALDRQGRLFAWGDNSSGQLGFDATADTALIDSPSLLPLHKLYPGTSQNAQVTSIAAGGANSFFTVEATKVAPPPGSAAAADPAAHRHIGRTTADTFALGSGIAGSLGNNRWTHVQSAPTKIPALSGLFEYDEQSNTTVPIRLAALSIGDKHAAAVMRNITYLSASPNSSPDDTNWGADVVFWGGNEFYQLGTGKRNNVCQPVYLQPLDLAAEVLRAKKSSGAKEEHRFHLTPRSKARLGDGRVVSVEQRVQCGRGVTCVYSGT